MQIQTELRFVLKNIGKSETDHNYFINEFLACMML